MKFPAEPFKIKVVEPIRMTTREERDELLLTAGNNLFSIPSDSIFIDLLTDSGTSAMSDRQWAGLMVGDEAYAGSRSFFRFESVVRSLTGFTHIIPTHQGRVAENLLFSTLCNETSIIPSNSHFDTTRANIEIHKATALDLVIDEAYEPGNLHPFKGNMDLGKLESALKKYGKERIPVCMLTITNNSGGGQPVSMENIRQVRELLNRYGVPLILDACRFAENAWFIKKREPGYANRSIESIAQEMFSHADGCTMSAKKDGLVNMGGFLALNDTQLARQITNLLILIEGFPTYGGLAGRDLEAIAIGLTEVLDENYLAYRTSQVEYLADLLTQAGIAVIQPAGGHAVYVDARHFYPHIPPVNFPGQVLVVELYRQFGIRTVEIGTLMFGKKDPATGQELVPRLDLVRLAIPRRVYTTMHMTYVAEALISLYQNREAVRGLQLEYEAPVLRHFTARLRPLQTKT
ncbi:MAG: tryptophanase [Bacteroidetes bacterium]|nr:tryptophanase [Bacteroidota bacterium]